MNKKSILGLIILSGLIGCSPFTRIGKSAKKTFFKDSVFQHAHVGVSVYDPETEQFLVSRNMDKYFVPASNIKIMSCYIGMKFIGTDVPGILYAENDSVLFLMPSGDPTFLHPDFQQQPVAELIKNTNKKILINANNWKTKKYAPGWSWDDYNDDYMPERSALPVYGNLVKWYQVKSKKEEPQSLADTIDTFIYSDPEIDGKVDFAKPSADGKFKVTREWDQNNFTLMEGKEKNANVDVPFVTNGIQTALQLIRDSLHKEIIYQEQPFSPALIKSMKFLISRPLDSMLKPMMHRSDNFFAEQTLAMSSMFYLGEMNVDLLMEKLMNTEFANMPDKPKWVDGSGLSHYNLFTPRDFVWVLDKMKKEIPWERIKGNFATGGEGTLGKVYQQDSLKLYAKTGTLSGVTCLSGYLLTKKNHTLIFSIMVNNHRLSASFIRNRFAKFLHKCIKIY